MASQDTVLVYGGTGAQGAPILRRLQADGYGVRFLTRSASASAVPSGAEMAVGDLDDADSLRLATQGCRRVVVLLPLGFDVARAIRQVENILRSAEQAGVELLVFDTSAPVPDHVTGIAAVDLKVKAEQLIRASSVPWIIVRPTIYLGNLTAPWSAPGIVANKVIAYPLPEDIQVAWSTWEDTANAVVKAISHPALAGRVFDIGGADAVTGLELGDAFSRVRGAPHAYASIPLPGFEAGLNQAFGAPVGTEIAKLYGWFAGEGRARLTPSVAGLTALGVTPTPLDTWIGRQDWACLAQSEPAA